MQKKNNIQQHKNNMLDQQFKKIGNENNINKETNITLLDQPYEKKCKKFMI